MWAHERASDGSGHASGATEAHWDCAESHCPVSTRGLSLLGRPGCTGVHGGAFELILVSHPSPRVPQKPCQAGWGPSAAALPKYLSLRHIFCFGGLSSWVLPALPMKRSLEKAISTGPAASKSLSAPLPETGGLPGTVALVSSPHTWSAGFYHPARTFSVLAHTARPTHRDKHGYTHIHRDNHSHTDT